MAKGLPDNQVDHLQQEEGPLQPHPAKHPPGITSTDRRGRHLVRFLHIDIELPETASRTDLISVFDPYYASFTVQFFASSTLNIQKR